MQCGNYNLNYNRLLSKWPATEQNRSGEKSVLIALLVLSDAVVVGLQPIWLLFLCCLIYTDLSFNSEKKKHNIPTTILIPN